MFRSVARDWTLVATFLVILIANARVTLAVSLQELIDGATLTVGNSRFVDWQLDSIDATGTPPDLAQIVVTPLAADLSNPGLEFAGNNQLVTSGMNSINLALGYRIERTGGGSFSAHTLEIAGITFGGPGGISYISDELATISGEDVGIAVALANKVTETFELVGTTNIAPKSVLRVTTNIALAGFGESDAINLSKFTQRFSQNGLLGTPGDYNEDGRVDAADYTVWRDHVGAPAFTLPNDTAGGTIGAGQYNLWKSNFGTGGAGAFEQSVTAVPEPATGMLALLMGSLLLRVRRVACFHA
jgi:hypothetical protein